MALACYLVAVIVYGTTDITVTFSASEYIVRFKLVETVLTLVALSFADVHLACTLSTASIADSKSSKCAGDIAITFFASDGVVILKIPKQRHTVITYTALNSIFA